MYVVVFATAIVSSTGHDCCAGQRHAHRGEQQQVADNSCNDLEAQLAPSQATDTNVDLS